MDAAWAGVIGGAVGAAGSLAGSVAAQVLAARHTARMKAVEREDAMSDRWFEEKRAVYLEVIEVVTAARHAMAELRLLEPKQRSQSNHVDQLFVAWEKLARLEPRVFMLGSHDMHRATRHFALRIAERIQDVSDRDAPTRQRFTDETSDQGASEYLMYITRRDLGIGDAQAPKWLREKQAEEWELDADDT